jgi:hypothetical protein
MTITVLPTPTLSDNNGLVTSGSLPTQLGAYTPHNPIDPATALPGYFLTL